MTLIDTRTPNPKTLIAGSTGDWEIVIGMEVHAQVLSDSKLFSGSSTDFGSPPNANVSFVEFATDKGHDAFLLDDPRYHAAVRSYFEQTVAQGVSQGVKTEVAHG